MVRELHNSPVWNYWPKIGLAVTKSWDFCPSIKARRSNHGFRLNQLHQAQRHSSDWAYSLYFMSSYPVVFTDFFHFNSSYENERLPTASLLLLPWAYHWPRICMLKKTSSVSEMKKKISLQMAQSCLKMLITCLIFMMCLKLNVPIWVQQGKRRPSI